MAYNPAEYYIQVVSKEAGSNRTFRQAIECARNGRQSIKMHSNVCFADDEM